MEDNIPTEETTAPVTTEETTTNEVVEDPIPTEETLPDGTKILYEVDKNKITRERRFYPSGKLKSISEYSQGIKTGHEAIFDEETSRIIQTQSYCNNILHGFQCVFDQEGKLISKTLYQNGSIN